jgi:hypothetical protein
MVRRPSANALGKLRVIVYYANGHRANNLSVELQYLHGRVNRFLKFVRRQSIWNSLLLNLSKSLVHLLGYIKRPSCCIASALV